MQRPWIRESACLAAESDVTASKCTRGGVAAAIEDAGRIPLETRIFGGWTVDGD